MANNKKISYSARDFRDIRNALYNLIATEYPNLLVDFNDASVGSMFVDLLAAVTDDLSFHTDRMFQETLIDYAQQRESLYALARTYGLKVPNNRPSVTLVDFSVEVPADGDTFNDDYLPIIRRGVELSANGGVNFETLDDIDFGSDYTVGGIPNRVIVPQFNNAQNIVSYKIVKREVVVNGVTRVYRLEVNNSDVAPFFEITLPTTDIMSVEDLIIVEGTNKTTVPTIDEFMDFSIKWFEVDSLAQQSIFIEDTSKTSDLDGIIPGRWSRTTRKFITEYTDNGFLKIIFGNGINLEPTNIGEIYGSQFVGYLGNFINNMSLGEVPRGNSTIFVRYRVGGGENTNIGANSIAGVINADVRVSGPDAAVNRQVRNSLRVAQPTPALGGAGTPTIEEIRAMIKYNFQAQDRAVTIKDYYSKLQTMPGKFGVPFRFNVWEENNKISVAVININSLGKLTKNFTKTMKENMADYLSEYRMINDYIEVSVGKIINLGVEVDIFRDKNFNSAEIISNVINNVNAYFNIRLWQMNDNIYVGNLVEIINNVNGVLNVVDIRFYNNIGNQYSSDRINMSFIDNVTKQIKLSDYTLYGEKNSIFEIKFPEKDIKVRIK